MARVKRVGELEGVARGWPEGCDLARGDLVLALRVVELGDDRELVREDVQVRVQRAASPSPSAIDTRKKGDKGTHKTV